jgi:4-azaleucine resistance transporter AzlC
VVNDRGYREGARAVLPLAVAVGAFGIAFGAVSAAGGFSGTAAVVMSITTFAGSAQFAAVSVLSGGGATATAIIAALLLNARYLPIGITVAPWLEGGFWSRLLHAHLMVDESWAIAAEGEGRWNQRVLLAAGAGIWLAWVSGTILGVVFGNVIGDPSRLGFDAAFPALFLLLLVPQLDGADVRQPFATRSRPLLAALGGGAIALVLTPVAPAGVPIIAAAAACAVGLLPERDR